MTTISLDMFQEGLAKVIGRPSKLRPFVCEGSPLDCDVFIVGYNPATAMEGDWWRFWKNGYGFQRELWYDDYLAQRDGQESKTRKRIAAIRKALPGVRILEANIDARPSQRKSEYPKPVTEPFDYLHRACQPKVIIAHGTDACAHLAGFSGKLIRCKHFIYVGDVRTNEIVAEVKAALT